MKAKQKESMRRESDEYRHVRLRVLERDGWRCQFCGSRVNLEVHHQTFRSHCGDDSEDNLITACHECHTEFHYVSSKGTF